MALALRIEKRGGTESITVQWAPIEQQSEKERLETLLLKADLGVPPDVLFEEYGYTPEDIARFDVEPEIDPVAMQAKVVNG